MADTASARLLDRAALLLRASDFIGDFCAEQRDSFAYPGPTLKLFSYVEEIRGLTRSHVRKWLARARSDADLAVEAESDFLTLAAFWSELHGYVKPAADAHALIAPPPLLRLAQERLSGVAGMADSEFVTLLTHDLNYAHHPLKQLIAVATVFRDAKFPSGMGFVAMPYSMGATLFANVMLYHELGHFAFSRLASARHHGVEELQESVSNAVAGLAHGESTDDTRRSRRVRTLDIWLREIFCDLLAVRLVGPAFALAFWDFKKLLCGDEEEDGKFTISHPAPNLRLDFQRRQLEADGWWNLLKQNPHYRIIAPLARMTSLAATDRINYASDSEELRSLLPTFLEIAPRIPRLVAEVATNVPNAVAAFAANHERVRSLLSNGIVPSYRLNTSHELLVEAVINAAYLFAQGSVTDLESNILDDEAGPAAKRQHALRRIDEWALKAVEDLQFGATT